MDMERSNATSSSKDDEISRLRAQLAERDAEIWRQQAEIAHARSIFREASVAARLGVWQCELPEHDLIWSDGVYEIFELPKGLPLKREEIVHLYSAKARAEMEELRAEAIRSGTGFTYEAEIRTARGKRRWMRITAKVDCRDGKAVRIFGIKQDITEERTLLDRTRYLAEYDSLTGLINRGRFQSHMEEFERVSGTDLPYSALVLIDIDHFKQINDTHGHSTGDQCLVETARRLRRHCRHASHIGRIGGDEFAILLAPDLAPDAVTSVGEDLVAAFRRGGPIAGTSIKISASIGIASAEDRSSRQLFLNADTALYAAKKAGRDGYQLFDRETMLKSHSAETRTVRSDDSGSVRCA